MFAKILSGRLPDGSRIKPNPTTISLAAFYQTIAAGTSTRLTIRQLSAQTERDTRSVKRAIGQLIQWGCSIYIAGDVVFYSSPDGADVDNELQCSIPDVEYSESIVQRLTPDCEQLSLFQPDNLSTKAINPETKTKQGTLENRTMVSAAHIVRRTSTAEQRQFSDGSPTLNSGETTAEQRQFTDGSPTLNSGETTAEQRQFSDGSPTLNSGETTAEQRQFTDGSPTLNSGETTTEQRQFTDGSPTLNSGKTTAEQPLRHGGTTTEQRQFTDESPTLNSGETTTEQRQFTDGSPTLNSGKTTTEQPLRHGGTTAEQRQFTDGSPTLNSGKTTAEQRQFTDVSPTLNSGKTTAAQPLRHGGTTAEQRRNNEGSEAVQDVKKKGLDSLAAAMEAMGKTFDSLQRNNITRAPTPAPTDAGALPMRKININLNLCTNYLTQTTPKKAVPKVQKLFDAIIPSKRDPKLYSEYLGIIKNRFPDWAKPIKNSRTGRIGNAKWAVERLASIMAWGAPPVVLYECLDFCFGSNSYTSARNPRAAFLAKVKQLGEQYKWKADWTPQN